MDSNQNDRGITDKLIDEIVEYVKLTSDIDDDEILRIYTEAICTNILIKTNRRIFVPELKYIATNLVKDKFMAENTDINDNSQSIQSMSEDGRSVNFGVSDILKIKLDNLAQKQINENENIINKFKLLYKT